ncbi:putative phage repressor [Pseudogulbenkiania sp. NH8B]|uniref:helix-turn-helix domain-containing protein n=1 Tax=Pseudogulbenkiania sp. (strain NH8B) TaxID=748280 RepID=UPI00022798BA|nr:helix-turn-helix domain-containing protein [Pseudogulbenkiania sp. NH8B]BAK76770.1 putative phage repressor [Pseudogulbenkiania sp. NH8B]
MNFASFKLANMETWNERLAKALRDSNLQAIDLANKVGVKPSAVTQWTNGVTKRIDGENLLRAAKALGVTADWLMFGGSQGKTTDTKQDTQEPYLAKRTSSEYDQLVASMREAYLRGSLPEDLLKSFKQVFRSLPAGAPRSLDTESDDPAHHRVVSQLKAELDKSRNSKA